MKQNFNTKFSRAIRIMSATECLLNYQKKRYETTYRISNGKMTAITKEGEMSLAELDDIYPTPHKLFYMDNTDRRSFWEHNIKSY